VLWQLTEGAPSPSVVDCNPNDTVAVIVESAAGDPVAEECFFCEDGGAIVGGLANGEYDVYLQLSDQPLGGCERLGLPEAETDFERVTILDDAVEIPEFELLTNGGFIDVDWSFVGESNASGCAALGATTMRGTALVAGRDRVVDDAEFDCADGVGTLPVLLVGDYDVEAELFDGGGVAIPGSAFLMEGLVLRFGGDVDVAEVPPYDVE